VKPQCGTFKVAFYLSSDGVTPGKLIKTMTVYGLSAGATKNLYMIYRNRSLAGQHMIAVVDSGRVIQESNEGNNRAVTAIR